MLKKIKLAVVALLLPLLAFGQTYPSPTFQNLTVNGTFTLSGGLPPASLAAQAANTVLANVTASSASPTAVALPSCSTANSALQYTSATGFSCGTTYALTSGTLAQFAATTSAQLAGILSDETGTGSAVFAISPTLVTPTLGAATATTPTAGDASTRVATTAFLAAPGPIGNTTANTGKFTTLQATSTITGFTGRLLNVQVFTASGTYTPTAGTSFIVVYAVGAGGGAGGTAATAAGQSAAGSGGAGGAFAEVLINSGFSGATVTIGAAGTGGAAGANAGGTGGTTSFGTFVSCPGGGGGIGGAAAGPGIGSTVAGGATPTISGATTIFAAGGYPSSTPAFILTAGSIQTSGAGGNSPFGAGGPAIAAGASTQAGNSGAGHGSGGGGPNSGASQAAQAGGNGTSGLVLVYEFSQ